jgi:D-lyxose ketol-isomerase
MAITREQYETARAQALDYFAKVGIVLTEQEKERIEVADFGLGALPEFGVQLITYVDTQRVGAKEVVLLPGQTVPEHRHPPVGGGPGKEETFRCRYGSMYLYVDGPPTPEPKAHVPEARRAHFTVWHEVVLRPGDQYTAYPDTLHWFQAGPEGVVISEFATPGTDEYDRYTDPGVARIPEIRG